MTLRKPFMISSRLMPGLQIGGAVLSLGLGPRNREGRTCYQVWIDLPDGSEHEITDLRSGCQGGGVQEGFAALLGFLAASAESYSYRQRTGEQSENEDLFPAAVVAWAAEHEDEITLAKCEIEETPDLITD